MGAQITFLFIFCSTDRGQKRLHWHNIRVLQAFQHLDIISCLLATYIALQYQETGMIIKLIQWVKMKMTVAMLCCSLLVCAYDEADSGMNTVVMFSAHETEKF